MNTDIKLPPFKVELEARFDKNDATYFIGKCRAPMPLQFKKGVVFFIFTSDEGGEELHIACPKLNSQFVSPKKTLREDGTVDRVYVNLERKLDVDKNPYYLGVVQDDNLELSLSEGLVFLVYTSKAGAEQLQISRFEPHEKRERENHDPFPPEVIRGGRRLHGMASFS